MLVGWKDIADRVSKLAGYDVSVDSIRKARDRDVELAKIISESVTGKPLVSEFLLDRWVELRRLPRASRARRITRAVIEAGQLVLI